MQIPLIFFPDTYIASIPSAYMALALVHKLLNIETVLFKIATHNRETLNYF